MWHADQPQSRIVLPLRVMQEDPPRALSVPLDSIDERWDVEERLGTLWRAARLGPNVEALRRHVLNGGERSIEAGQFRALDAVAGHGPCPVRELAIVLGLEPSSVTRALARLESQGWIEKNRSPSDQREVLVGLTESGQEQHRFFVNRAFEVYQDIFVVFSSQERVLLADLLERMLKSTEAVLSNAVDSDGDTQRPEGD